MEKKVRPWPRIYPRESRRDWCLDLGVVPVTNPDGTVMKRRRRLFAATKEEAEVMATEHRARRDAAGLQGAALTAGQIQDAIKALALLNGRVTLQYAAHDWIVRNSTVAANMTLNELYHTYGAFLNQEHLSGQIGQRHVESMVQAAQAFADGKPDRMVDVRWRDIEAWLAKFNFRSPQTKLNYIRGISAMFAFAVRNEWIAVNPAALVKRPRIKYKTPQCLTAVQVELLLREAQRSDPAMLPRLCIGFFAGLRSEELAKLDWSAVHLDAGVITVSEKIAKKGIPRSVTIAANLATWLQFYNLDFTIETGDPICNLHPKQWYRHLSALCKTVGVEWTDNAMRHTFATHHLAFHQDAGLTAKELGHQDGVRLLYRHYANSGMTKATAEAYWRISPMAVAAVNMKTA